MTIAAFCAGIAVGVVIGVWSFAYHIQKKLKPPSKETK